LGYRISLLRCLAIPRRRFGAILKDALTPFIHPSKLVLGVNISLFRRLAKPVRGLGFILRHTATFEVHQAKIVLGFGIPLLGRLYHGLDILRLDHSLRLHCF